MSVTGPHEVAAALAGGADIIDAKDPREGALGAVTPEVLRAVERALPPEAPLSLALGDVADADRLDRLLDALAPAPRPGGTFTKVGFLGLGDPARVEDLAARAVERSGGPVVLAAYAEGEAIGCMPVAAWPEIAARAGARGVLVDTADKRGPGLFGWLRPGEVTALIEEAHGFGLFVALAGRLSPIDAARVAELGADIVGVRGAACEGGRLGVVSEARVRELAWRVAQRAGTAGQSA
ncbi:MAG: (5-formylfuran-3-yl)methyl phosphate synthase [Gemmatimonadota bacterium]